MLIQEMPYIAKAPDKADMKRRILHNNMNMNHLLNNKIISAVWLVL